MPAVSVSFRKKLHPATMKHTARAVHVADPPMQVALRLLLVAAATAGSGGNDLLGPHRGGCSSAKTAPERQPFGELTVEGVTEWLKSARLDRYASVAGVWSHVTRACMRCISLCARVVPIWLDEHTHTHATCRAFGKIFEAAQIDGTMLLDLQMEDLEELGAGLY